MRRYRDAPSELGYAVTDHTAQGRTVHTGLAVVTGAEDRQHASTTPGETFLCLGNDCDMRAA